MNTVNPKKIHNPRSIKNLGIASVTNIKDIKC